MQRVSCSWLTGWRRSPCERLRTRSVTRRPRCITILKTRTRFCTRCARLTSVALDESFLRIGRISDPIERLRKLGEAYIEVALEYPSHYRFMFMTPHPQRGDVNCDDSGRGDPDQDAYAFVRVTIAEALAAGLFRDDHDDPDLLSQVFWSGVHGVVALRLIMGEDTWVQWRPVEDVVRTAIDLIIRGLLRNGRGSKKEK